MDELASQAALLIPRYGIYIAGVVALISYLSEVYSSLKRTGPATAWTNTKMLLRLIVTTVSVAAAFFIISAQYEKKTPMAQTADNIIDAEHACLDAARSLAPKDREGLDNSARPVALQCLAYAVRRDAPDHTSTEASVALAEDIDLGQRLLHDGSVDGVLKKYFGVNGDTFLGTGYSVPRASADDADQYSGARSREYLAPNYCLALIIARCKTRQAAVWSWMIDPRRLNQLSVRDVVREKPSEGPDSFADQFENRSRADDTAPWLIRFSIFPTKRYQGTVGRPEAAYVFFSEMEQMLKLPLREALRRSGATEKDLDNQEEGRAVFVWVVAPSENADYTRLATWHNVFGLVKSIDVDDRLSRAAAAAPDSLMRRLQ